MNLRFVIVDVFTDRPLAGNQLAVFTDARAIPEELLQPLAREWNFSETAFVLPKEGDGDVRIRIFMPAGELPFAGHPTLGTAFVLGGPLQGTVIRLETGAGTIPVALEREGAEIVFGRMELPVPRWRPFEREAELLAALGVASSELPVDVYDLGPTHVYVTLPHPGDVARLAPDFDALAELPVGVNCVAPAPGWWKVRMFAPAYGLQEDPATGSAAGPLALHLARHGRIAFGDEIEIHQGAEVGRPSTLYARADGTPERIERVEVGGAAVLVARGELRI